jgi:AraC-like DNA-binding protein
MHHQEFMNRVDLPELQRLPTPVYLRTQQLQAGEFFAMHTHDWHQFVYATTGSLIIQLEHSRNLITPLQGVWLPAGTLHATGTQQGAAFRSLYFDSGTDLHLPAACQMYSITSLLREVICELHKIVREEDSHAYRGHLHQLVIDQLQRLMPMNLYLPWPRSPRLQALCESIYQDPANGLSIEDWGRHLGASSRTLTRHFEKEVCMTLRDWRTRLRLFKALEWLERGIPIMRTALDLGYASQSAFSYMFKCHMGCSPRQWLKESSRFKTLISTYP